MPDHPPLNSYVAVFNSTSITLIWGNIPEGRIHGVFVEYFVNLDELYIDGQLGRNITMFTNMTFYNSIIVSPNSTSQSNLFGANFKNLINSVNPTNPVNPVNPMNSAGSNDSIVTVEYHAYTFVNLTPFTNYTFRIGGCTVVGCGVPSIVKERTKESGSSTFHKCFHKSVT